jgi:hypothetical protein
LDDYCVDDVTIDGTAVSNKVQTVQKVKSEIVPPQYQFDEKCTYKKTLYVKNNNKKTGWLDAAGYIKNVYAGDQDIANGYYVFMSRYTDNRVYHCVSGECKGSSVEEVRGLSTEGQNPEISLQEQRNILGYMSEYSAVTEADGFSENVVLKTVIQNNSNENVTLVLGKKQTDWRLVTIYDYPCDISVMKKAEVKTFGGEQYKCDARHFTADDGKTYYVWISADKLDLKLGICNAQRAAENLLKYDEENEETYTYICKSRTSEGGSVHSEWKLASLEEAGYECSAEHLNETQQINAYTYTCQNQGEEENPDYKWVEVE